MSNYSKIALFVNNSLTKPMKKLTMKQESGIKLSQVAAIWDDSKRRRTPTLAQKSKGNTVI